MSRKNFAILFGEFLNCFNNFNNINHIINQPKYTIFIIINGYIDRVKYISTLNCIKGYGDCCDIDENHDDSIFFESKSEK